MYQTKFDSVSLQIQISIAEKTSVKHWAEILKYFMSFYAKYITKDQKVYIGHIKAISIIDKDNYIKLSIYKPDITAEVDMKGEAYVDNLKVSVNSFVYSVDYEETISTFEYISQMMEKEFLLCITLTEENTHHIHNNVKTNKH